MLAPWRDEAAPPAFGASLNARCRREGRARRVEDETAVR
jgi:hypothetical protein